MEIAQVAAFQAAGAAAMTQQSLSVTMAKKAAEAQMQMANMIEQQAKQAKEQYAFSVYA